jgi:photosystem II stability/assembly factor-like uncharacterized protein
MKIPSLLFILLFLFSFTARAQDTTAFWEYMYPSPQGNTLRSVKMLDSLIYVAVGDVGTIMKTTDNGANWNISFHTLGYTGNLNSISFSDKAHGVCVGQKGYIFFTGDSGNSWSKAVPSTSHHLNAVCFTEGKNVFAAGNGGTLLRSTDAGMTWALQAFPSTENLETIVFPTPAHGIIGAMNGFRFISTDSGKTWTEFTDSIGNNILSLSFFHGAEGAMSGELGAIWLTHDGGNSWLRAPVHPQGNCNAVATISPKTTICASDYHALWITTDAGVTWNNPFRFGFQHLLGISFLDDHNGVVVGRSGAMYHTSNGGRDWDTVATRILDELYALYSVNCIDSLNTIACGASGLILHSYDAGVTWSAQYDTSYHWLYGMHFQTPYIGTIVGDYGTIMRTRDGGRTWSHQDWPKGGTLHAVSFSDTSNGIAVGDYGLILVTQNGGRTWYGVQAPDSTMDFTSVAFVAPNTAVIGGVLPPSPTAVLLRTTNGGFTWKDAAYSPTTNVSDFLCLSFPTAKVGFAGGFFIANESGHVYGLVYRSLDSGKTWQYSGTAEELVSGISFATPLVGTAVGWNGNSVHTSDGGTTWHNIQSSTTLNLFSVSHYGPSHAMAVGYRNVVLRFTSHDSAESTGVENRGASTPAHPILVGNYPNPLRDLTTFSLSLENGRHLGLSIYDEKGALMEKLFDGFMPRGEHTVGWDASVYASGVYFARLSSDGLSEMLKVVIKK